MSRYDEYRSSAGTLDSRDRYERYSRGPPVMERSRSRSRPRRMEDDRFEFRLHEEDRYGPPARAAGRHYEDEHLVQPSGPLVAHDRRRRREDSPSFAPPRLLRRQSSLDTFDRIPRRKMEPPPRAPRMAPPMRPRPAPGRYREHEVYEDIRIAEPEYYGDEEFREFEERETMTRHRRSSSAARRRHEEKPYPRKGKTRIPRKFVHIHAVLDLGYPFKEEDDTIIIQKALSKEQIDEVITLSRQVREASYHETEYLQIGARPRGRVTTEHLQIEAHHSPRASHDTFIFETSPSRREVRDVEYEEVIERTTRPRVHTISRPRSVSVHNHGRVMSPVRYIEPRAHHEDHIEIRPRESGSLVLARPRQSDHDISDYVRQLEEETRMLRLERQGERQGGIEITRQRETDIIDSNGNETEITEVRKRERKEPPSRVMRAMMATLT